MHVYLFLHITHFFRRYQACSLPMPHMEYSNWLEPVVKTAEQSSRISSLSPEFLRYILIMRSLTLFWCWVVINLFLHMYLVSMATHFSATACPCASSATSSSCSLMPSPRADKCSFPSAGVSKSNKRSMSRNVEMTVVTNEKDRNGSLSLLILLSILRVYSSAIYAHTMRAIERPECSMYRMQNALNEALNAESAESSRCAESRKRWKQRMHWMQ